MKGSYGQTFVVECLRCIHNTQSFLLICGDIDERHTSSDETL